VIAMVNEGKKILVLDDDPSIRSIISEVVSLAGMEPTLTAEGHDTVACYGQEWARGEPFDAVVLDLNVNGGWGGREALSEIKKINPKVKSLLISGFQNEIEQASKECGFNYFLTKPFEVMSIGWYIGMLANS
jgi:two-component system, cell cycle sensor histidine kinase and response regulator CckA